LKNASRRTWRFRIEATASGYEALVAELWSLGTLGLEETGGVVLAYFAGPEAPALASQLAGLAGVEVGAPEPVPDEDWEREWRRGLAPRQVGPLWIRPSWCDSRGEPELVIDPRQAFGSGEHATTRMSLALLLGAIESGDRVLDVGTGSGVLLLGASRFGANGIAFDVDPVSCANARDNALANGLELALFCGTPDALASSARFDVVVANMLLSRMEPLLARLCAHARSALILSGYLASERDRVHARVGEAGMRLAREERESQSGDVWCASLWRHARDRQSSSSSSSIDSTE
jgi:ribosomal protein L11 methyltransferase